MPAQTPLLRTLVRRWRRDDSGVSAVEFAIALPFLITLYFGGYQTTQAVSAYRKMTILTRTLADLTTQYTTLSASNIATIMNASSQVMAPFNTSSLSVVLTEFQVPITALPVGGTIAATVTWTQTMNATSPYQNYVGTGTTVLIPASVCQPGASIVLSSVSYAFTPAVGYKITGSIVMSDHLYMSPRQVSSIPFTG